MYKNEDAVFETIFFEKRELEGKECNVALINYLEALNIQKESSKEEFDKINKLLLECENPIPDVLILLQVRNWRPHLIGCLAAFLLPKNPLIITELWSAFDRSSWVSPQIAATLSIVDENFINNALVRLSVGALIKEPSSIAIQFHQSEHIENPKGFMSLWGLLQGVYNCPELESENLLKFRVRLAPLDRDHSSDRALAWRSEAILILNA